MRRMACLVTSAVALTALVGVPASSQEPWRETPGGWASGDLDYVDTIPFEAATGIDAVRHGSYLYTTTWRSFSIYDVSDPLDPELLSQTPVPGQLINENPETNGEILLLSNDTVGLSLDIYDVTDKTAPELIGTFEDTLANHMWTCVFDCRYAYGGRGSILDLADPTQPEVVGLWTDLKRPRGFHAIDEIAPGLVLTGSNPILYLDARDDPENPVLLTELDPKTTRPDRPYVIIGPAAESLPARVAWPLEGEGRHLLVTMETPFSGECDEESGTFLSYDTDGWDRPGFEGFELMDEYAVTGNGLPSEGSAPVNAFGCGAYGLHVHPSHARNGLVATTWFEHGTRVLRVGADGTFTDAGGFVGLAGNAVRPLWMSDEILYVVDAARGIDILRFRGEDRRHRSFPYVIPAGDLDGDGAPDTISAEAIPETELSEVGATSYAFRVRARRGTDGAVLWERPDRADALVPARLGPGAAPGALLVDGFRTWTGGGGGFSEGGSFGDRVDVRELSLSAVDGEGELLWQREFDTGTFAGAAHADEPNGRRQAVVADQFPTFAGLVQATPGPADDALVSILTRRETPDQVESTIQVGVVDGATGDLATSFTVETPGARTALSSTGDLDGDGLDDLVILRDPAVGGLTARRGTDGAVLWTNASDIVPFNVVVDDLGDVTGDGVDDLAVRGSGDVYEDTPPRVTVLDGSDGSVLLSTEASTAMVVGALDDEGTVGILTQRVVQAPERSISYRLFTATGEPVAERVVPVPEIEGETTSVQLSGSVGDIDGDGLEDAGHRYSQEEGTTDRGTVVSGRTLATLLDENAGLPLGAAIEGQGDDLVRIERVSPTAFSVIAQDGATATLWSTSIEADERYERQGRLSVSHADVDGDGVPDVVLNIETSRFVSRSTGGSGTEPHIRSWVLRGTDGAILWTA